jgi:hypothetical protein
MIAQNLLQDEAGRAQQLRRRDQLLRVLDRGRDPRPLGRRSGQCHLGGTAEGGSNHKVTKRFFMGGKQGDQIGGIFAYWDFVNFVQPFENDRRSAYFWAIFYHSAINTLILSINGFGYILGYSFVNSSGHPGGKVTKPHTTHITNIHNM